MRGLIIFILSSVLIFKSSQSFSSKTLSRVCNSRSRSPIIFAEKKTSEKIGRKKRWEIGRFLNTVRFYNGLRPNLPFLPKITMQRGDAKFIAPKTIIWSKLEKSLEWGPLDDVVMGGVSKSNLNVGEKFDGNWTGFVTSENNGFVIHNNIFVLIYT